MLRLARVCQPSSRELDHANNHSSRETRTEHALFAANSGTMRLCMAPRGLLQHQKRAAERGIRERSTNTKSCSRWIEDAKDSASTSHVVRAPMNITNNYWDPDDEARRLVQEMSVKAPSRSAAAPHVHARVLRTAPSSEWDCRFKRPARMLRRRSQYVTVGESLPAIISRAGPCQQSFQ